MLHRLLIAGVLSALVCDRTPLPPVPGAAVPLLAQAAISDGVTDADLQRASAGRSVAVGQVAKGNAVILIPLELYVARVLAGEGEPGAPEAAQQALAVAIRTFALFNAGRHRRDGFDLCDTTHCQVLRTATATTRRVALSTAGRILTYNGAAAEIFYSASCGGRSENAADVWPAADLPYLRSIVDDVHDDDEPWTLELPLRDVQRVLSKAGFVGRLTDVRIEKRSDSGRATRLALPGLEPNVIGGDQFRAAIGAAVLKSTAFSLEHDGDTLRFTGRGYGHGVGLCVIGAGRRARRGETFDGILSVYFPGLTLSTLPGATLDPLTRDAVTRDAVTRTARATPATPALTPPVTPIATSATAASGIIARVPAGLSLSSVDVERMAVRARDAVSRALGISVAPITIDVHESLETFRSATGRPWWVSAVAQGTTIDLAPPAVLSQRDGVEAALRVAIAELLLSPALAGRPAWVKAGAARYFARQGPAAAIPARLRCPADAELTLAISAAAQRAAESLAEACFARAYAKSRDWRAVR